MASAVRLRCARQRVRLRMHRLICRLEVVRGRTVVLFAIFEHAEHRVGGRVLRLQRNDVVEERNGLRGLRFVTELRGSLQSG